MSQGAIRSQSSTNIDITSCTFQNNSATLVGGAVMLSGSQGDVSITTVLFTVVLWCLMDLQAMLAHLLKSQQTMEQQSMLQTTYIVELVPLDHLLLQDVVFKDNHCSKGGAIYFGGVKVAIFGNTHTGSQFSSNSAQGAIQGQNGFLLLHGNITFTENRGVNGGAISLYNNVPFGL